MNRESTDPILKTIPEAKHFQRKLTTTVKEYEKKVAELPRTLGTVFDRRLARYLWRLKEEIEAVFKKKSEIIALKRINALIKKAPNLQAITSIRDMIKAINTFPPVTTLTHAINLRAALEEKALEYAKSHIPPTNFDKSLVAYVSHMSAEITTMIKERPEDTFLIEIDDFISETPEDIVDLIKEIITKADPKNLGHANI